MTRPNGVHAVDPGFTSNSVAFPSQPSGLSLSTTDESPSSGGTWSMTRCGASRKRGEKAKAAIPDSPFGRPPCAGFGTCDSESIGHPAIQGCPGL